MRGAVKGYRFRSGAMAMGTEALLPMGVRTINNPFYGSNRNNTTVDGKQQFIVIADSKGGTSNAVGPTPPPGIMFQWDRTLNAVVPVGAGDILYNPTVGSQWPSFGIEYNRLTGFKPVIIQNADGGSCFLDTADVNNDWSAAGNLYPNTMARARACLNQLNLTEPKGILVVLGVNDVGSGEPIANVLTAIDSMVTRLTTDWPNTPIYFSMVGQGGSTSNRKGAVRHKIQGLATPTNNVHVCNNESIIYSTGNLFDSLHFSGTGNIWHGTMLARYITSNIADKEIRRISTCTFWTEPTRLIAYQKLIAGNQLLGNWPMESLQCYAADTKNNAMVDLTGITGARDFGFGWTQNAYISTDGVSTYMDTFFEPLALQQNSTITDMIAMIGTGAMTTAAGTLATFYGQNAGGDILLSQNASSQTQWSCNAGAAGGTGYATDTKLQDNTHYGLRRTGTTASAMLKAGSSVSTSSTAASTATSDSLRIGARGIGSPNDQFYAGQAKYSGFARNSTFNYAGFLTLMDQFLIDIAS